MKITKLVIGIIFMMVGIGYSILNYMSKFIDLFYSRLGYSEPQPLNIKDHIGLFMPGSIGLALAFAGFFIYRAALKS